MRDEFRLRHLLRVKSNNGPAATDKTTCISNHVPPPDTVGKHGTCARACRSKKFLSLNIKRADKVAFALTFLNSWADVPCLRLA